MTKSMIFSITMTVFSTICFAEKINLSFVANGHIAAAEYSKKGDNELKELTKYIMNCSTILDTINYHSCIQKNTSGELNTLLNNEITKHKENIFS
jgi:hypothetical protein